MSIFRPISRNPGVIRLCFSIAFLLAGACNGYSQLAPVVTDDERNRQYHLATVHPGPNYPQNDGPSSNSEQNPTLTNPTIGVNTNEAVKDRQAVVVDDKSMMSLARNNEVENAEIPKVLVRSPNRGDDGQSETKEQDRLVDNTIGARNETGKATHDALAGNNLVVKKLPSISPNSHKRKKKPIFSNNNKNMLMLNFEWPIKGKIKKHFTQTDRKGIEIIGRHGQKIRASEAGKVVYSGQGLIGFGKVLVIKHNKDYLSAYANNGDLFVKEGQRVKKGQDIAKLGASSSRKSFLHFEIRKNGKPVNPLSLLP